MRVLIERARRTSEQAEENNGTGYDSDSSSNYPYDTIDDIVEDIKTDVECLMDLDPLLQTPIDDLGGDGACPLSMLNSQLTFQFYASRVSAQLPRANISLVNKLSKANWDRFMRLEAERSSHVRLLPEYDCIETSMAPSKIQDLVPETLVPDTTVHAACLSSSTADGGYSRIPPLSEEAKNGILFACDACGKKIRLCGVKSWRKHLFADLRPYVCPWDSCLHDVAVFQSHNAWINHFCEEHDIVPRCNGIVCPLCLENTGGGLSAVSGHIARHLEDIVLAALPRKVDSDNGSGSEGDRSVQLSNSSVTGLTGPSRDTGMTSEQPALGGSPNKPNLSSFTSNLSKAP